MTLAIDRTTTIVSAYVGNNSLPASSLPGLIATLHDAIDGLGRPAPAAAAAPLLPPGVTLKNSVNPDYLVSLETGERFKSLKRHLSTRGLTPAAYRAKWGLPPAYPMVAANYAARRSELAKGMGLGLSSRTKGARAAAQEALASLANSAPKTWEAAPPAKPATKRRVAA